MNSKNRLNKFYLLATLVVGLVMTGGATGIGVPYPFNFIATYTTTTGVTQFAAEGTLTQAPVCAGTWVDTNESLTPVLSSANFERIKVSVAAERYVLQSQSNFILRSVERSCVGVVVNTNVQSECAYDDTWSASNTVDTPRTLPAAWSPEGNGSGPREAKGLRDEVGATPDLRFASLRIDYDVGGSTSNVPFTGRMHFVEPAQDDDIYSEDYIAGFCVGFDASPQGCCKYIPTKHGVFLAAESTSFGAPPFGTWDQRLMACNIGCL